MAEKGGPWWRTGEAPHIRDLNLNAWHEAPEDAVIPRGTVFITVWPSKQFHVDTAATDYRARDRGDWARYFTEHPLPDPREAEGYAPAD